MTVNQFLLVNSSTNPLLIELKVDCLFAVSLSLPFIIHLSKQYQDKLII